MIEFNIVFNRFKPQILFNSVFNNKKLDKFHTRIFGDSLYRYKMTSLPTDSIIVINEIFTRKLNLILKYADFYKKIIRFNSPIYDSSVKFGLTKQMRNRRKERKYERQQRKIKNYRYVYQSSCMECDGVMKYLNNREFGRKNQSDSIKKYNIYLNNSSC